MESFIILFFIEFKEYIINNKIEFFLWLLPILIFIFKNFLYKLFLYLKSKYIFYLKPFLFEVNIFYNSDLSLQEINKKLNENNNTNNILDLRKLPNNEFLFKQNKIETTPYSIYLRSSSLVSSLINLENEFKRKFKSQFFILEEISLKIFGLKKTNLSKSDNIKIYKNRVQISGNNLKEIKDLLKEVFK